MLFLAAVAENAPDLENISIANAGIVALLGYSVVFFGLILLMMVVICMGKIFVSMENKAAVKADEAKAAMPTPVIPEAPAAAAPQAACDLAPGTAGELKLYDTPPKTAAMIMAIVANQMGKPLNELRFISIKEVK